MECRKKGEGSHIEAKVSSQVERSLWVFWISKEFFTSTFSVNIEQLMLPTTASYWMRQSLHIGGKLTFYKSQLNLLSYWNENDKKYMLKWREECDIYLTLLLQLMKATVLAETSVVISLLSICYADIHRHESGRCLTLPFILIYFFLSFHLSKFSVCINIYHLCSLLLFHLNWNDPSLFLAIQSRIFPIRLPVSSWELHVRKRENVMESWECLIKWWKCYSEME
jgi:hypothetical protein